MGFTSELFLFIFMPVAIILYCLISKFFSTKVGNVALLILSLGFYAWSGLKSLAFFVLLMLFVYILGIIIYRLKQPVKKRWIIPSCALCVVYLFLTKYLSYICTRLFASTIEIPNVIVILGVSFVVFEIISYITDIYRGDATPGSLIDEMLFLSLFPKLISGPIVLWKDFQPMLKSRSFDSGRIIQGLSHIAIGFAKKAIIADTFGLQIQKIETAISGTGVDSLTLWLRSVLYFFQIYYDFSGYSDIAIGLCNIFGFDIKENFNFPYISCSITEFWRRWHISLGTWFREYVYIPLGGNRKGNVYVNLFIVFLLTGIWHGANSTFFVWGIVNGLFVVAERFVFKKDWYKKIPKAVKWLFTSVVVLFSWTIFMSSGMMAALTAIKQMLLFNSPEQVNFTWKYYLTTKIAILLIIAAAGSVFGAIPALDLRKYKFWDSAWFTVVKRLTALALFELAILFIVNSSYSPFLYFQF